MVEIRTVAVLGAGVMGAQIAALLANAGLTVLLFDQRRELAGQGLERARALKPPAFHLPELAARITALGIEEDCARLEEADWVCEAIPEILTAKQALFQVVAPLLRPGTLLSTNTSGLPAEQIARVIPPAYRSRFLVTHFFNPPRYLRLLELAALPDCEPGLLEAFAGFARTVLGKGVVPVEPTPNFIANRIGVFGLQRALQLALEHGLGVEEVDALTGTLLGRPKSATFGTADLVGLDTLLHVTRATHEACADDPWRAVFQPVSLLERLVERGDLGRKSGAGFYRKHDGVIQPLDLASGDFGPPGSPRFDSLRLWRRWKSLERRVEALFHEDDRAGRFLQSLLGETLAYAAWHLRTIAGGRIERVDRALCWGFGWEAGPFALWDAMGVRPLCHSLRARGVRLAPWLEEFLATDHHSLRRWSDGVREVWNPDTGNYRPEEVLPGELDLEVCRRTRPVIHRGWSAGLLDLGDSVAGLELHSVLQPALNPIDESVIQTLGRAVRELPARGFRGLVIGHGGTNFCAGANLNLLLALARAGNREAIEGVCAQFQQAILALRHAPFPVVAAPFGLCLGGGVELVAGCDAVVAHAELYAGLVEAGVGLIPAGGGCLRVLEHWAGKLAKRRPGPFPPVQQAFGTIAFARVSGSAPEARSLGLLPRDCEVAMDRSALLARAKARVLELAADYRPPDPDTPLILPGPGGITALEQSVLAFRRAGRITDHDAVIARSLARVLCGGDGAGPASPVTPDTVLALERREFATLALMAPTQARLEHMLKTGKPLRN